MKMKRGEVKQHVRYSHSYFGTTVQISARAGYTFNRNGRRFSISFDNSARAVNTHAVAVETVVTVVEVFFDK